MKYLITNVETQLIGCVGIHEKGAEGSQYVFDSLKRLGCWFFNFSPQYPLEKFGEVNGDILPNAGFFHRILAPSARLLVKANEAANLPIEGDAIFSFNQESRLFSFSQAVRTTELISFDELADRQIEFLKALAPLFRPQFSRIDEMGENVGPSESIIGKPTLTRFFWYNIFGPAYCEKYGKEIFLNAPAYQTEDLNDFGVAVKATEKMSEWLQKLNQEQVDYFRKRGFPGIKIYRAKRS